MDKVDFDKINKINTIAEKTGIKLSQLSILSVIDNLILSKKLLLINIFDIRNIITIN